MKSLSFFFFHFSLNVNKDSDKDSESLAVKQLKEDCEKSGGWNERHTCCETFHSLYRANVCLRLEETLHPSQENNAWKWDGKRL